MKSHFNKNALYIFLASNNFLIYLQHTVESRSRARFFTNKKTEIKDSKFKDLIKEGVKNIIHTD